MSVLIIKNIISEGSGTIGKFLKQHKISSRVVELGKGELLPSLERFQTLVILGGPMGVYEMERYPNLIAESRIIREAINRDMKVLGICLGAQMIAHCLGAEVYPGGKKETGWHRIELTGEGLKDPLMQKLAVHPAVGDFWRRFKVLHMHGDTFDLPISSVHLARSDLFSNQAFRFGSSVYALQFHIEVTREMLCEWFEDAEEKERILSETERIFEEYTGRATQFYKAFFETG